MLNDDLYRRARVVASTRGSTLSAIAEEALRLVLRTADTDQGPSIPIPAGETVVPRVDVDDSRAVQDSLDAGREPARLSGIGSGFGSGFADEGPQAPHGRLPGERGDADGQAGWP